MKCQCEGNSFPSNKHDRLLNWMERVSAGRRVVKSSSEFHFDGVYLKNVFILAFKSPIFCLKQRLWSTLYAQMCWWIEARCSRDGVPWGHPSFPVCLQGNHPFLLPSFIFLLCFASPGLRNPTEYLCSAFKDFVPSGVTWKISYGQILSLHRALQTVLNSTVAVYWREEYHLTADTPRGGRRRTAETMKRGKAGTSWTTGMRV